MEVSVVVADYLFSIKNLRPWTQKLYEQRLRVFSEWCTANCVGLEQVNNRNIYAFVDMLKVERKPSKEGRSNISQDTLFGYVQAISTFIKWCNKDEEYSQYVKRLAQSGVKLPRREKHIIETFSDKEIEALFAACKIRGRRHWNTLRDEAILCVLIDTGVRADELGTLLIGNVNISMRIDEESYITVMGKGRKEREIPVGSRARRVLGRYIREQRRGAQKDDPVFLTRYKNKLRPHALFQILGRLKEISTLPADAQVNPHKFRHTFAARYMASGGDIYDLSHLMGHASVTVTEGYLRSLSARGVRMRKSHYSILDNL